MTREYVLFAKYVDDDKREREEACRAESEKRAGHHRVTQ